MKISIPKIIIVITLIFINLSCSDEKIDINNLNETIYVRHKKADMPAYIHGNASEKVFLIVLHGGPGGSGLQYRSKYFVNKIEKNNAVVYFDQRGSGNSQGSYSKSEINIDIMAEDVLALAEIIKSKYGNNSKLFLLGHSWGGTLGPAVLLKNQSIFKGWIDVDGAHSPKDNHEKSIEALKNTAHEQIKLGNSVSYWKGVINLTNSVDKRVLINENFNKIDFFKINQETVKAHSVLAEDGIINKSNVETVDERKHNLQITYQNYIYIISILAGDIFSKVSFASRLKNITIPSLVLFGKYDTTVSVKFGNVAYNNLGSSKKELFIFDKSAHSPMFTEPALFSEKVIQFVNKHK